MECVRLAPAESVFPKLPCCRCADRARFWDRIGGKTYCPGCVEAVIAGDAMPIAERADRRRCAICHHPATLRYLTFPLQSRRPVELDLCGEHLAGWPPVASARTPLRNCAGSSTDSGSMWE